VLGAHVGKNNDIRGFEQLHYRLILGGLVPGILKLLCHGVDVVRVLCCCPCDVKDGNGLALVHVSHVLQTTFNGYGNIVADEMAS
jgi:hypothetical protein